MVTAGRSPSGGARFELLIPAGQASPGRDTAEEVHLPPEQGPAAVLIMDDEDFIREILRRMLQMLGYDVLEASRGEDALDIIRERGGELAFAILDLTIRGGMGGRQTAAEIRTMLPAMRLVVTTGYCDDPVVADYQAYGFRAYLPKPFDLPALKAAIADVLG